MEIAAVKCQDGKVSRPVQTDMSFFARENFGQQVAPEDWHEDFGVFEEEENEEDQDLFDNADVEEF